MVAFWFQVLCVSPMVGEFSKGSVRHRGLTATSAAICLLPAVQPSHPWCRLVIAFASGALLTLGAGFWWLLNLED